MFLGVFAIYKLVPFAKRKSNERRSDARANSAAISEELKPMKAELSNNLVLS